MQIAFLFILPLLSSGTDATHINIVWPYSDVKWLIGNPMAGQRRNKALIMMAITGVWPIKTVGNVVILPVRHFWALLPFCATQLILAILDYIRRKHLRCVLYNGLKAICTRNPEAERNCFPSLTPGRQTCILHHYTQWTKPYVHRNTPSCTEIRLVWILCHRDQPSRKTW